MENGDKPVKTYRKQYVKLESKMYKYNKLSLKNIILKLLKNKMTKNICKSTRCFIGKQEKSVKNYRTFLFFTVWL